MAVPNNDYSLRYIKPLSGPTSGGTAVDFVGKFGKVHHSVEMVFTLASPGAPCLSVKGTVISSTVLNCETPPIPLDILELPVEATVTLFIDGVDVRVEETIKFCFYIQPFVSGVLPKSTQLGAELPLNLTMFSPLWGTKGSMAYIWRSQLIYDNEVQSLRIKFIEVETGKSGANARSKPVSTTGTIIFKPGGQPVVQCTVPSSTRPGKYHVFVSLNNGKDYTGAISGQKPIVFSVFEHPEIFTLIPACTLAGEATLVRIIGSNFLDTGNVTVSFKHPNGNLLERVPATVAKPNKITCRVPRSLQLGECQMRVALNSEEAFESSPLKFTVYNAPRFETLAPSLGPARGGSRLRIYRAEDAMDLLESGDVVVRFRSVYGDRLVGEVSGTVSDDGKFVECLTPANPDKNTISDFLEMVYVHVAVDGTNFILCAAEFGYHSDFTISGLTKQLGPMKGGTDIAVESDVYFDPDLVSTCIVFFTEYEHSGSRVEPDFESIIPEEHSKSVARTTTTEGSVLSAATEGTVFTFKAPRWLEESIDDPDFIKTRVSLSLNGQDFDQTPVNENVEDTLFTYHRDVVFRMIQPTSGSLSGGSKLKIISNVKLGDEWSPYISFRGKRDVVVRGEVVAGEVHCTAPHYPVKLGKSGFEDVRVCLSLNGFDFSGDEFDASTHDAFDRAHVSKKATGYGDSVKDSEKIPSRERFRFHNDIEGFELSPDHGSCSGGSRVTISGYAGLTDRRGFKLDGLPDTGGPYLVQLRYIDSVGIPRSIDRQGTWSNGTIVFTTPFVQPAQHVEVAISPNRQDVPLLFRTFVYVSDPKMLAITPRMAPISFETDVTFELTEKVGKQCCARLRFPCGNSVDGSDVSETVSCMSIGDVQGVVTCRLPLPSVHEDVPRFTAFVASHLARSLPLEVAVDGQNFKASGDLVDPKLGMQLYYFPDVQRVYPCGGPFDAAAICTLTLSRDYFIDQPQEAGRNSSPIEATRNVEVKFYSPDLELELLVPAIVRKGDTIELECPHFKDWPKDDLKPFKAQVWLSIRDKNFCPTGLSYLFYPQPRFTDISPRVGHMRGGTPLVITGERFCDLGFGQTVIKIGNQRTIGTVLDDETIRCISPMLPPGKYDVQVSLNGISFHPLSIDTGGPKLVPLKFIVGNITDLDVEPHAALGPVTGGSALTIAFTGDLVSLLQKDTIMAVHFRTPRENACVEGVFTKRRTKKGGAKVLLGEVRCATPPFEKPSFATVHLSFFGMEESESAACTFTFHRIPEIALLQPSRVPTSGGSRVKAYLKIAKLLPKRSEGRVSPKVKLTLSSADADRDRPNEVTLDSDYDASAGHFSLTMPTWPSAETISLKVSLNGGADFVVLKGSSLKYFNQPPAFETIAPCGGPVLGGTELKMKLPESVAADIEGVDITVAFHFPHSTTERTLFRNIDATDGADVVLRPGLRASGSVVQCEVPECASEIDIARVLVSLNGCDFIGKRHHNTFIPFHIPFIYYVPPIIDSIEPQCCANEGGTVISIQGSGFHKLGVKYQGAKVQFITTKNVVRTVDATIVSDGIIQCVAPKIRNYDGLSRVHLGLNGQQYADISSEDGNQDSSKEIRFYHGPVWVLNVTGSCEGGEEVIFRGSRALLLPILDEGMMAQITFVSTVKSSKFTRTVEAFLKDETSATVDIACITPKVPTPAPARIEISFKDRAETPVKETITLKLKYRYTFFPPPELVSIHPFGGPIAGGTQLLLSSHYISSKKMVTIQFERSYDGDESSDDSTDSNVMEGLSVPCTIVEASKTQAKLQCGLVCAFPDFSDLLEVTGKNSARFDVGVIINDHKYSSTLSYVAYRVPTGQGFDVQPKTIYKGPKSTLAVSLGEPGFFPDRGSWVHLRLASNGAVSMSALSMATLHVLGQVGTNGTATFQCPEFISTGKWSCELSFNAIDYMSCGDIEVLEPAVVSYVYPSKMSVERSTRVTIGCCAASPSAASLLHGQRIRVRGMKRSQRMLSGPLEVTPLYATQRLKEQFGEKLHVSHMKVTIVDVDVERSTENCDIVILLSCNGVTIPLAPPKRRDGVMNKTASEPRGDGGNEKTSPRSSTNPGAVDPVSEKKPSDFTSPSKTTKGRRQSKFLPSMPASTRIKMSFVSSAMAISKPDAKRIGSFSVISTNSAGLSASDVADHSSPTLASDALAIEAMVQGCSVHGALDFTNQPVEVNGGVIEVSVACVFRDPIKLQPTSCSIIATGEFPCKHLADAEGLFDDFTFRCALDQTVASQSQVPVTRSATFELEITPGKTPPRPDFLLRAEFPPLKDSFGSDTARVAVDLCSNEKCSPPAIMSPARHIAVFDPSSWTILGIEPTEGRANTETPVVIDVSGFEMVESVSLQIELEDGTLLHADGDLQTSSNTVGVIRRVVCAIMPALDGFTGDYTDAIIQVVTDGEVLCTSAVRFVYITSPLILGFTPTYLPHTSGGLVTIHGIGFIGREQTHALLESGDAGRWQVDPEQYNMSAVENGPQSASQMWSNDDSPEFDDDYTDSEVSASPQNGPNPYILEPLSVRRRPLNFVKSDDDRVVIRARIRFINQSSIEVHIPPHVPAESLIICMPGTDGKEIRSSIPLKCYDVRVLQPTCGSSSGGSELEVSGVGFPSSSAKIHDFEAQPYVRQALYAHGKLVYSTKLEGRIAMDERKNPIVICRTQVLPAHLLSDFSFVEMATDVSFSGIDGPFTRTQLPFRIYRPLGCRKIEPAKGLVPGKKADVILVCSNLGGHVEAKLRIRCESARHSFGKVIAYPTYQLLKPDVMKLILPFFSLRERGYVTKLKLVSAESSSQTTTAQLWTHQLSTTDAETSTGVISKGTVEVSLNGHDWFERASLPIMFATPARVNACVPHFGSLHGGTAIEIHGENFALGRCWVAFLVRTRYNPAEHVKERTRGIIKFKGGHEPQKSGAALRIQTSWRRFSVLRDTRSGTALPCTIVPAFAVTPSIIKCATPPALLGGDAMVVVSVNGVDFEYVTSRLASLHKDMQCHTNFCFQTNASISAIVTDDGVITDRLYIHGEGFECPSTDLITVRFRAPDGASADDDDDERNGNDDASSSTSSASIGAESDSFAPGTLTDGGTVTCETPLNLAYRVSHRIAVSLNGVDFSNEVEFLIQNSPVIASVEPEWILTSQPATLHIFARNIPESDFIFVKLAHQAADGTLREVIRLPGEKLESRRGGVTCELPILDSIMASMRCGGQGALLVDVGVGDEQKFTDRPLKLYFSSTLPEVSSCLPTQGPSAGGTIRIHGNGFCDKRKINVRLVPIPRGLFDTSKRNNVDMSNFQIAPLVMEYGAQYLSSTSLKCNLPELEIGAEYFIQISFNRRDFSKTTRYCTYKCVSKNQVSETTSLDGGNLKRTMRNFKHMKEKLKDVGLSKLRTNLDSNPYCEIDYEGTIDAALANLGSGGVANLNRADLKVVERKQQIQAIDPSLLRASTARVRRAKSGAHRPSTMASSPQIKDSSVLEQMQRLVKHNPEETKRLLQKTFQTLGEPEAEGLPPLENSSPGEFSTLMADDAFEYHRGTQEIAPRAEPDDSVKLLMTPGIHSEIRDDPPTTQSQEALRATFANESNPPIVDGLETMAWADGTKQVRSDPMGNADVMPKRTHAVRTPEEPKQSQDEEVSKALEPGIIFEERKPVPPLSPPDSKTAHRLANPNTARNLTSPKMASTSEAPTTVVPKAGGQMASVTIPVAPAEEALPAETSHKLTFDQLCKEGITQLFPGATTLDLMEVWSVADPLNTGEVTLEQLMEAISTLGKVNTEIGPGDYDIGKVRDKFSRRSNELPTSLYERPATVLIPFKRPPKK